MTNKVLSVLAGALLAMLCSATAGATHTLLDYRSAVDALRAVDPTIDPPPNDESRNFAVGGFQGFDLIFNSRVNVGLSAHSGPLGVDPQGHVSETLPGVLKGRFDVTCLAVAVNEAALGLSPTNAASNDEPNEFVLVVSDSGIPGGTGDKFGFLQSQADDCAVYVGIAGVFGFPIDSGNILVHQAVSLP